MSFDPDALGNSGSGVRLGETVALVTPFPAASARFFGLLAACVRLLGGRLPADRTRRGVTVTREVPLPQLRVVFPGY